MQIESFVISNQSFVKLTNKDNFEVVLSSNGASIYSIKLDNILLTQTHVSKNCHKKGYHGKTIGRVANRIKGNKISIENIEYKLENNEGLNTLHGGLNGLSYKDFQYQIERNKEFVNVIFTYLSADLESGFPGNVSFKITYSISEKNNSIKLTFEADTDKTTPCALTNHTFFTMGENNLANLTLKINSSKCIFPNKKDLTTSHTGYLTEYLDFRKPKIITKDINEKSLQNSKTKGYDHYYFFDKIDEQINQIELSTTKYLLKIKTNFEGTQIYTDNYKTKDKFYDLPMNTINRAIAIEPSSPHNKIHLLKKGIHYCKTINYIFERRKN